MGTSRDLTVETGFQIMYNVISGQAQDTEGKGRAMSSVATKRLLAICLIALSGVVHAARESDGPPDYLLDPVLGLRLPSNSANLETLPSQIRAICEQISDNATWTGQQWIFGVTREGQTTYYLLGGYFTRKKPIHGQHRHFQPDQGGIYEVRGQSCNGDPAREVFEVRDTAQVPQAVLQRLARDFAARLAQAVGGPERLRNELARQHIAVDNLSPELRQAFEPVLTRTGQ